MMRVTVVVDNMVSISDKRPLRAEHGLSLLVEHEGQTFLFDMGQTDILLHNLSLLQIHPADIDVLVISHGHYDHTGGLLPLLHHGGKKYPLYANDGIFAERHAVSGESRRFIGIPYTQEQLTNLGIAYRPSREPLEIAPNLWFSGQVPRQTEYELGDTRFVAACDGVTCPDCVDDDGSLYYATSKGLIVISGCAHAGLVNTVRYGMDVTGCHKLRGWIGGTHLGPAGTEQQEKTLPALEEMEPEFIMANHCTGFLMLAELQRRFGRRFIPGFAGTSIEC